MKREQGELEAKVQTLEAHIQGSSAQQELEKIRVQFATCQHDLAAERGRNEKVVAGARKLKSQAKREIRKIREDAQAYQMKCKGRVGEFKGNMQITESRHRLETTRLVEIIKGLVGEGRGKELAQLGVVDSYTHTYGASRLPSELSRHPTLAQPNGSVSPPRSMSPVPRLRVVRSDANDEVGDEGLSSLRTQRPKSEPPEHLLAATSRVPLVETLPAPQFLMSSRGLGSEKAMSEADSSFAINSPRSRISRACEQSIVESDGHGVDFGSIDGSFDFGTLPKASTDFFDSDSGEGESSEESEGVTIGDEGTVWNARPASEVDRGKEAEASNDANFHSEIEEDGRGSESDVSI
jgi:hypothetical protein